MLKLWGMWSTPLLPSFPGPLWLGVVAPDKVLTMGQIELNFVLILNWIVWNGIVLTFKLLLMLNRNVWNRTVYMYKNRFGMFEIELLWHINYILILNLIVWNKTFFDIETAYLS